jgi:beta-glucosidase
VKLAMRCTEPMCGAGAALDLTRTFRSAPIETWQTLHVPLSCWKTPPADLKDVEVPFNLSTAGRFSLIISAIQLAPPAERFNRICP